MTHSINNATKRVNNYVSTLKHGVSLKYVKGLSNTTKTLANICLERQNNGSTLILSKAERQAFGIDDATDGSVEFIVDYRGSIRVYPNRIIE